MYVKQRGVTYHTNRFTNTTLKLIPMFSQPSWSFLIIKASVSMITFMHFEICLYAFIGYIEIATLVYGVKVTRIKYVMFQYMNM